MLDKLNVETFCMEMEMEETQGTQTHTYKRSSEDEAP